MREGSRADDERAIRDGFRESRGFVRVLEQFRRTHRRFCFAPVRLKRSHHCQATEPEVCHGPRSRTNVQRIARRDKNDFNPSALVFREQAPIVLPPLHFAHASLHSFRIDTLLASMIPETVPDKDALSLEVEALCATARWCYARGWVPATSGNFSVRAGRHILITPTGLDKGALTPADLLEIDPEGHAIAGKGKPSAETGLHTVIYRERPGAHAILHVHTIWNTLLSGRFLEKGYVPIEGYELLKGLSSVTTHEHAEQVPITKNSQDYALISTNLAKALHGFPLAHGVLLSQHGLYTWGESVAEARRHLEALEFLFEVEGRRLMSPQVPEIVPRGTI